MFAVASLITFASPVAASKKTTSKPSISVESPKGNSWCLGPGCPH
jgi:hypothetical protein